MSPPRILFFGSDAIALELLKTLHSNNGGAWLLHAVISQPDRPTGRGQRTRPNPVAAHARAQGLQLWQPHKPDPALADWIRAEGITLGVVMAYGHLLRQTHLDAPALGMVNFHASLLPHYRGASPVETAVAEGERQTGVSLMQMIRRMDAGPVADRQVAAIAPGDSAGVLRERLAHACIPLALRALPKVLRGAAVFRPQDEARASYCRKLCKSDGQLDFHASAHRLACRVNGLDPWPGAHADHGGVRLKFRHAEAEEAPVTAAAGTVLEAAADGALRVATGHGVLVIHGIQKPGGRMLPAKTFLQGWPLKKGDCLSGGPMTELTIGKAH